MKRVEKGLRKGEKGRERAEKGSSNDPFSPRVLHLTSFYAKLTSSFSCLIDESRSFLRLLSPSSNNREISVRVRPLVSGMQMKTKTHPAKHIAP